MSARSRLFGTTLETYPESFADSLSRYRGFGSEFFPQLFLKFPKYEQFFCFFRDNQSDDVWAICETTDLEFGVQLDPDIECICIWDSDWHDEIGAWLPDPVGYAIKTVTARYPL